MQRTDYFIRRIVFSLITLAAILTFNFFLFRIVPGDPVSMVVSPRMRAETRDLIREQYGLDKPVWLNFEAAREEQSLAALLIVNSSITFKVLLMVNWVILSVRSSR